MILLAMCRSAVCPHSTALHSQAKQATGWTHPEPPETWDRNLLCMSGEVCCSLWSIPSELVRCRAPAVNALFQSDRLSLYIKFRNLRSGQDTL